ncbi:hypothetical protein OV320_2022 [Actinobacteria bacterium OV320]|nr:hypothetical protein OV320_2022 [Actinobacteria bacterium OV320]
MVTALENRASDEQERAAPLRYSAAWDTEDVSIAEARAAVRTLLADAGHHPDDRPSHDAQLVVTELVANALRHAPGPGDLALEVTPDAALLHITVRDSSPPPLPPPPAWKPASRSSPRSACARPSGRACPPERSQAEAGAVPASLTTPFQ